MSIEWTPASKRRLRSKHVAFIEVYLENATEQETRWKAEQIRRSILRRAGVAGCTVAEVRRDG